MTETPRIRFVVPADLEGQRLDRACASHSGISRSQIQRLNGLDGITVDGRARPDSYPLVAGETVEMNPPLLDPPGMDEAGRPVGQDIDVPVVYEDNAMVVVNKPAGLVVHPAHGNWDGTLVNALIGRGCRLSALGGEHRPGVVHRLDKDTSGLVVLAKTDDAYHSIAAQLKAQTVSKQYHGIAHGHLGTRAMRVDAPIGRHPTHRQRMAVNERSGKPALTELFVVDRYSHFDYIRVTIFTGRTHQIRVHLSHLGHPLFGDPVYGGRKGRGGSGSAADEELKQVLSRHALHASLLSFEHPENGRRLTFRAALPTDMREALETLYRFDRSKEVRL